MFHVLVVEDEWLIRDAVVEMVNRTGGRFKVVGEASSCEEAWRAIQELWPTVVITDIQMPDRDGLELIRMIREHRLPIVTVVTSGHDRFEYAQNGIRLGVSEYLLKPISEQELHRALDSCVHRLETIEEPNRLLHRMQSFIDRMHEIGPALLIDEGLAVADAIFRLHAVEPGARISFLRLYWGRLTECIVAIYPEYAEKTFDDGADDNQIRQRFQELLHDWVRHYPQFANNNVRLVMKKACDFVRERFTEELTPKQLADYSNMSVSYFGVLFKQYTGQSFINYLNQVRIEKAMELLRATDKKIYEIADEVGYASLPYFNRVFKNVSSYTPNEYRKSLGL